MAHIFKHPTEYSKGIIVFTHKEFNLFNYKFRPNQMMVRNPKVFLNKSYKNLLVKNYFDKQIDLIRNKYLIGIHWGFASKDIVSPKWVDFHMTANGTATFVNNPFIIPLNSANFTPEVMRNNNIEKYWDIICVAKNDHKKNYPKLLKSIRNIYDSGYQYKVLFIIASNKNEDSHNFYTNILDDYFSMFNSKERELFTIIKTHPETGFQGFSYSFLSHMYNQSKVFTIFSQKEGECRVIKEAQLCGLPIVVKSDMEGGGRDYLNKNNSIYFDDYEQAHKSLINAVESYNNFDFDTVNLRKDLSESSSIEKLHEYFKVLFENHNQEYDRKLTNLDNLNRRLPAHYFDQSITWASSEKFRFTTTDITNSKMLNQFCNALDLE
ncbi:glycosyltransferase [Psychrobacter sp. UBA5136]|uniref:glycosyltransferase n=1 Tax=Psychrobacter sp. UBA5136 TaxID=1947356 RepID=UPI0025DE8BD3|nr:glycosyltransferase [Psychrobacter sp. UBA5136]